MISRRMPLASAPPGRRCRVVNIVGGLGITQRLYEMGLTPGSVVEVESSGGGPVVVKVRGVSIVIGRGMASKIIVELLDQ